MFDPIIDLYLRGQPGQNLVKQNFVASVHVGLHYGGVIDSAVVTMFLIGRATKIS